VSGLADRDTRLELDRRGRADRHGGAVPNRGRAAFGENLSTPARAQADDAGDNKNKRGDDPHGVLLEVLGDEQLASMTRSSAPSVTPEWTVWWPFMRKRLLRFLRSRGVSAHAAEDAVQDVAERLLTRQVPHTDVEDLMRWCMTVARNSAIDQHRRVRRSVPLDCRDADADDGSELVDMVEARIRLDRVLRALGTMSYEDARCVMASIDDEITEVASPALRARRHRLRRRLSELVGGFGLIGLVARVLRPRVGRTSLGLGSAAMASVALVTVVVGGPRLLTSPDHLRLHATHATVQIAPVAEGAAVVRGAGAAAAGSRRDSAASAGSAGSAHRHGQAPLHVHTPDERGTVDVKTWDHAPSDHRLLCVSGLVYVDDVCVAPALTGRHLPPAQLRTR
jgi:hypothetical protein